MVVRNINVYHWFDKLFTGVYFVLVTMRVESVWMTMQKTPEFIFIGLVK